MIFMHDYTPKGTFIEAIAAGVMVPASLIAILFQIKYAYPMLAFSLLMTFLPSLHLMKFIADKKDYAVLMWSPLIIMARSFATAFGIFQGILQFSTKPEIKRVFCGSKEMFICGKCNSLHISKQSANNCKFCM